MDSVPQLVVEQERDKYQIPTSRWSWEVYDAATGGPIRHGSEDTKARAEIVGVANLAAVEGSSLYCDECEGIKMIGIDACIGCCGRR